MRRGLGGWAFGAFFLVAGPLSGQEPPAIVAITIDTSGSISAELLQRTRELAVGVLESLPAGSQVALLEFNDQSRLVLERTTDAAAIQASLGGLQRAGRFTALYDALYDASRYLKETPRARKAIILITDGLDENSSLQVEDGLKVAVENKIPVYCVGIGRVQEPVLRRIAKLTTGEYQPIAAVSGPTLAAKVRELPEPELAAPAATQPAAPAAPGPVEIAAPAPSHAWVYVVAAVIVLGLGLVGFGLLRTKAAPRGRVADPGGRTARAQIEPIVDDDGGDRTIVTRTSSVEPVERTMMLRLQPRLIITHGTGEGQIFNLSSESALSIGRAPTNDIPLTDTAVSGEHCRVRPEEGAFVLHDLKSTNGTFVNERRVARHRLSEGDVVRVGETQIQFTMSP